MSEVTVSFSREEVRELLTGRAAIMVLDRHKLRRSTFDKLQGALNGGGSAYRLLAGSFEDGRGKIQDLIDGPIDSVTRITTVAGAVRGNHFHKQTTQWTYVISGSLLVSNGLERLMGPGEIVVDRPGQPHAWKAIEDTDCLVFTRGPRSGENYEQDTFRLETPLLA
jgi:quercetin dioxygenase-like cupin family protein